MNGKRPGKPGRFLALQLFRVHYTSFIIHFFDNALWCKVSQNKTNHSLPKMKISLSVLLILVLAGSCRTRVDSPRAMNPAAAMRQKAIDEIREVDQNFSIMAEKQGLAKAFTTYAADEAIKMNDGAAPTVGFDAIRTQMSQMPTDGSVLSWQVLKADAAQSGELGYTFGQWMLTTKDDKGKHKAQYGVYVTVWKRQRNGHWRFVVDGGNNIPEPK